MAEECPLSIVDTEEDDDSCGNDELLDRLKRLFQSGNINFLIGSGASMPAIPIMGNIEQELTNLYKLDTPEAKQQAETKETAFKDSLKPAKDALTSDSPLNESFECVSGYYRDFLKMVETILRDRKNSLLPKQANIFTTNYDLFFEKASEGNASLILNDGFDRSPKLSQKFEFSPKNFFNTVYHNGTVYGYKVELASVNLIKLHGSSSWKTEGEKLFFDVNHDDPTIILPRKHKFQETLFDQTYYDLLRLYSNELDKENALLLVFGFSFEDEHIFDITQRALKNPTLQVVIFAYSQQDKNLYCQKFVLYSNVLIVFRESGKFDFNKLNNLLNNIPQSNQSKG
jgi:hypothetical protein